MAAGLTGSRWREGGSHCWMASFCRLPKGPWAGQSSRRQAGRTIWLDSLAERLDSPCSMEGGALGWEISKEDGLQQAGLGAGLTSLFSFQEHKVMSAPGNQKLLSL